MTRDEELNSGPTGWIALLHQLDAKLQERWPEYTIAQIKEKFGTLRFYADSNLEFPDFDDDDAGTAAHNEWYKDNVEAFHDTIHEYEAKSASICQLCGKDGKLGTAGYWWATFCPECAPEGWVANDVVCSHPSIADGTCTACGRQRLARLEHTDQVLRNVHLADDCTGEWCTIHNRSEHSMRSFPQNWRDDRMLMERVCPHGVGHPDPDDYKLTGESGAAEAVHGCDGCCTLAVEGV
jgi:hypothetical protein